MKKSPERKALEKLVETNEVFMYQLGETMSKMPSTEARGRRIGSLVRALNIATDSVRYSTLGIDFRRDKPLKMRVEARLKKLARKK